MIMIGITDRRWGKVYFPRDNLRQIIAKSEAITLIGVEMTTGNGIDYEVDGDVEEVAQQLERAVHGIDLCNVA